MTLRGGRAQLVIPRTQDVVFSNKQRQPVTLQGYGPRKETGLIGATGTVPTPAASLLPSKQHVESFLAVFTMAQKRHPSHLVFLPHNCL